MSVVPEVRTMSVGVPEVRRCSDAWTASPSHTLLQVAERTAKRSAAPAGAGWC